ncbi:17404_t:CDS:2, partial [Funneliformis geosporum]
FLLAFKAQNAKRDGSFGHIILKVSHKYFHWIPVSLSFQKKARANKANTAKRITTMAHWEAKAPLKSGIQLANPI